MKRLFLSTAMAVISAGAASAADAPKPLEFPAAADGRQVLAVDLHIHTVFSDGMVWPTIRVEEARRDGLSLIAVTDHIEWRPKLDDIPNADRNRPYVIADDVAARSGVLVVNGAEVTRGQPIGHINAVFLSDVNKLTPPKPSAQNGQESRERFANGTPENLASARASLDAAKAQGGFVFINHPSWDAQQPDGIAKLSSFHKKIIADKVLDGIEVVNGNQYSEEAFRFALENNLAVIGSSDIHGLIAWDYETEFNGRNYIGAPGVRTATLVLADGKTPEAIRKALFDHDSVAISAKTLYGRERDLAPLVAGALKLRLGAPDRSYEGPTQVYALEIVNDAPIPFSLRSTSATQTFYDSARSFTVPAHGVIEVKLTAVKRPEALRSLNFEVLNAYVSPEKNLQIAFPVTATAKK